MATFMMHKSVSVLLIVIAGCMAVGGALAQQPAPADQSRVAANSSEAAMKAKILASAEWNQAFDEFQKWLSAQAIYSPADGRSKSHAAQFGTAQSPYRPPKFNPPPQPRRQFFVDQNGNISFGLPF
jgi:hypothetical protein